MSVLEMYLSSIESKETQKKGRQQKSSVVACIKGKVKVAFCTKHEMRSIVLALPHSLHECRAPIG